MTYIIRRFTYSMSLVIFNKNLRKPMLTHSRSGLKISTIENQLKSADMPDHQKTSKSHIPESSMLFEKIVPALLFFMGIVTVTLILFAAGVLLGIIHF